MAKIHIIYDPKDKITVGTPSQINALDLSIAVLSIADDIESVDIYNVARKLAEMLLEQIR